VEGPAFPSTTNTPVAFVEPDEHTEQFPAETRTAAPTTGVPRTLSMIVPVSQPNRVDAGRGAPVAAGGAGGRGTTGRVEFVVGRGEFVAFGAIVPTY
jgi:hypothetical protein